MRLKEEDIQINIQKNMNYLMGKKNIKTRKDLSTVLGISQSQLTKILNEGQIPTLYPFFVNVRQFFGCTIDDFIFTDMEEMDKLIYEVRDEIPEEQYAKFYGLYQIYYYDNAVFKGRERSDDTKALKSGVLILNRRKGTDKRRRVLAALGLSKEEADQLYAETAEYFIGHNYETALSFLNSQSEDLHLYRGEFEMSANNVYISLQFGNRDKSLMIFHRPESTAPKYIGGLGAVASVSKGRNSAPCIQYVALSRNSIVSSHGEIAEHLITHYPGLKTYDAVDHLVDMIHKLYGDEEEKHRLSEEEKKLMIRYRMDKVLNEAVERNLFRSVIVSEIDDDEFYHYLKRVNNIH